MAIRGNGQPSVIPAKAGIQRFFALAAAWGSGKFLDGAGAMAFCSSARGRGQNSSFASAEWT